MEQHLIWLSRVVKWCFSFKHKLTTRGKNNINIWLLVIISILIGQLRNIFNSKQPRSYIVVGCSVKWPNWNVTILFRFFQRCLKWQPKRFFMLMTNMFWDYYMLSFININSKERQNSTNSTSTRRRTQSQKTSGSLCSKLQVFIWRHLVYVPKLSTTFRGILICVILGPGICKNTICYSGSSKRMWVYISCLFSILPEPISNTRMFIYFVYCIFIIVHL
jgi:hypothetical protein